MAELLTPMIEAPWTADQVESINEFQVSGAFHPFTCGACRDIDTEKLVAQLEATGAAAVRENDRLLVAEPDKLICPTCDYTQTWVWDWMANFEWKKSWARLTTLGFGGES